MMTKQIRLITFFRLIFVLRLIYETGDQIKLGALALDQSYPGVPGERFLGPIVRVVGTVGQQQCVRECRDRPKLCRGVSYRKQHLLCELVSDTERVEPNSGYVRFELDQKWTSQCASCSSGEKCITLSSNKTYCVRDTVPHNDCAAYHKQEPSLLSGIYRMQLPDIGYVNVFCEMDKDSGGWTVFQRRRDGSVDFFRNWTEYKHGFGDLTNEFWLGNDILHYLLGQGMYKMRMDMADFDNETRYVKYSYFYVGDEASNYRVTLFLPSGNVDDCFTAVDRGINDMMFSTKDKDNDIHDSEDCAKKYRAGWWYSNCHCANPNGEYLSGNNTQFGVGITYEDWRGQFYSLKSAQFMVKPNQFSTYTP